MAIEFNYYNFKRTNQLKYEADIDLSGLVVKSNPTTSIIDEDTGEATETNLDEIKDEKVNFVYTGAFNDRLNPDGEKQGSNNQPLRKFIFDENLDITTETAQSPVYTAGEILIDTQSIDYRDEARDAIVVSEGSASETQTNPTFYNVRILPRHELMRSEGPGNFSNRSSVSADVEILAALNLWSNASSAKEDNARGFIDRKTFFQRISNLQQELGESNIGIEVVEYPQSLTEGGDDLNASGLTRNSTVGDLSNAASAFIDEKILQDDDLLAPLPDADITPFTLSIKEGFRGWFSTKDELYNSYLQQVSDLRNLIANFSLASVFVDEEDLEGFGYSPVEINTPTSDVTEYTIVTSTNTFSYPPTAFLPDDTDTSEQTFIEISVGKSNVYQLNRNPDKENRWEFVLNRNGNKVLVNDITFSENPSQVYKDLLDAQSALSAGISATLAAGILIGGGGVVAATAAAFLSSSNNATDNLNAVINRIKRYEEYTNESVFPSDIGAASKYFFTSESLGVTPVGFNRFEYDKRVARVLVPVDFGFRRSKRKKKLFGFSFTDYVYEDLEVRWVYVNLIDTSTFTAYRRNQAPSGNKNFVNSDIASWSLGNSAQNSPVEGTITTVDAMNLDSFGLEQGDTAFAQITNTLPLELNGFWEVSIVDENTLNIILDPDSPTVAIEENGVFGELVALITPFEVTQPDDENTPIRIDYSIPYLPDDDTLRNLAFESYGPFDQSEFAVRTRSGGGTTPVLQRDGTIVEVNDDDIPPGWEIFPESSKEVQDMREGIDIYNKVNFLLRLLIQEFGENRVNLVETTRSLQDQNNLQLGGPSSNFLSWHNFGLAARIIINRGDREPIVEGSEDFFRLFDIAESFTAGAANGDYGEPCTVVWCARLVAGSDIFDWEFLPIGVGHKEAWKFRDAAYRQQDPYYANAYVNVTRQVPGTSAVEILKSEQRPPEVGPYIYENSKAYREGTIINNEVYIDPNLIPRYPIPSNLVLKDLQEFLYLIQNRQDANGTDLGGKRTPDEWKSKNPRSFEQLIQYYGMIGNFSSARTLISGDYVRRFEQIVTAISKLNPVEFVRAYLGEEAYFNARIIPEDAGDNSFISLATGLYTTPVLQVRSIQPEGSGNTFGQEQIDFDSVEFGQYRDGVFIPEETGNIDPIVTDEPVLSGYLKDDEGNITVVGGDAFILHSLVADQIVESFDEVKQNWLNIDFKVMHDRITESPNARVIPVLENEFGTIMSQDLLSFKQLREMYQRIAINSQKRYVDSGVVGAGVDIENPENESVFEKLVSNAQLSGVRKVKISNETLVEEEPIRQIDVEKVVEEVNRKNVPKVRDIL